MYTYFSHMKKLVLLTAILSFSVSQNVMYLSNGRVQDSDSTAYMNLKAVLDEDVRGFQAELVFNGGLVSIDTIIASDLLDGFTLSYNQPQPGTVKIIAINFAGKKIEKGFIDLAEIKFKVDYPDQLTVSRVNVIDPVLSSNSGASIQPGTYPGYLIHSDQDYVTVNRVESAWNMNLNSIEDLAALQFSFDYDTKIASIDSILPDPARLSGLTLTSNRPQPGNIKMVVNSLTNQPISKGEGSLLSIHKNELIPLTFTRMGWSYFGRRVGAKFVEYNDDLYLLGGENNSLVKYNIALNEWSKVSDDLNMRVWPTAEIVGATIYAIGGRNTTNGDIVKNQSYDLVDNKIEEFADMLYPVQYMGSVVHDGQIYVLGGATADNTYLDKVQKYDPATDTWTELSPMPTARTTDAVVYNGKIYAVGGYSSDGTTGEDYKFIDVYDIGTNTWLSSIEMPVYLSAHSLALYKDFILMVSDYDDHIGKIFGYNITNDSWINYSSNFKPRRHVAAIIKDDKLYSYGGNLPRSYYDPQNDSTITNYDDLQVARIATESLHSINDFGFSESFGVKSDGTIRSIAALNSYHINSSPVISSIPDTSVNEDTPIVLTLNATDSEGDPITFSAKSESGNVSFDILANQLTIIPNQDWYGTETVKIFAHDGNSRSFISVKVTYLPVNDAPYFSTIPNSNALVGINYEYEFAVADVDHNTDSLTYTVNVIPAWLSYDSLATISGTPDTTHIGSDSVSIAVTDGSLTTYQNYSIKILPPTYRNSPPKITSVPITSVSEGNEYKYIVVADDGDGDPLNYKVMVKPDWIKVTGDTLLKGIPQDGDVGNHNIAIVVNDGYYTVRQEFVVKVKNVNDPPVFTSTPILDAPEDTLYSYTLTGSDPDGDSLTFQIPGLVDWLTFDGVNTISGTPDDKDIGTHAIIAVMSDGFVNANQAFFVTVTNVNDAPVFTTIPKTKAIAGIEYSYVANFSDPDINASALTTDDIDIITSPSWLTAQKGTTNGVLEINLNGTPANTDAGTTYPVSLSVNDGVDTTFQNFTIEVLDASYQNTAPSYISNPSSVAYEDSLYTYKIYVNDPDPNDTLKLFIIESPSWLSFDGDTTLSGTPDQKDVGNAKVRIEATDGFEVVFQEWTISVSAVNDPPRFTTTPTTVVYEDSLYVYKMKAEDTDSDDATLIFIPRQLPSFLIFDGTNKLSGRPKNSDVGEHSAILSVTDGSNASDQRFIVNVKNTNDSPSLAKIDDIIIPEDSLIVLKISAQDEDGDTLTFGASSDVAQISFIFDDEKLTLTPFEDWFGTASIDIFVNDGYLSTSTNFTLNVSGSQDAPKPFEWITPQQDSLFVDQSNYQDIYSLKWEESKEVDNEDLSYYVYAQIGRFEMELIHDTTANQFDISYEDIMLNVFENMPISRASVTFNVRSTDGIDTTEITGENRILFIDRREYLTANEDFRPTQFALHDNYPNPFNPTTQIRFDLPEVSDVQLVIYNMIGQQIRAYKINNLSVGFHSITWDATNDFGDQVSAGVYLYQIQTNGFVKTKKMILLK